MIRRVLRPVVQFALILGLLAAPGLTAQAATVDVDIAGFAFSPDPLNVPLGTTVRWTNQDGVPHTTTSDVAVWDSGTLGNGAQYSHTFTSPGSYPYHCDFHPTMTATVIVSAPEHVPAMGPFGMGVLLLLVSLSAVWFLRRRMARE